MEQPSFVVLDKIDIAFAKPFAVDSPNQSGMAAR
jgi:hypothetical protein